MQDRADEHGRFRHLHCATRQEAPKRCRASWAVVKWANISVKFGSGSRSQEAYLQQDTGSTEDAVPDLFQEWSALHFPCRFTETASGQLQIFYREKYYWWILCLMVIGG